MVVGDVEGDTLGVRVVAPLGDDVYVDISFGETVVAGFFFLCYVPARAKR